MYNYCEFKNCKLKSCSVSSEVVETCKISGVESILSIWMCWIRINTQATLYLI